MSNTHILYKSIVYKEPPRKWVARTATPQLRGVGSLKGS